MPLLGEPALEGGGDGRAHAFGLRQLLLGGGLDPLDGAELAGQRLGGDRADVSDGEAGEDAGEGALLGRLDVVEHGEGVLLRLALLVGEEGDDLLLAGLRVALGQAAVRVEDVGADGQELVDGEVEEVTLVAQRGSEGSRGWVRAVAAT